jgi:general stress protein 26
MTTKDTAARMADIEYTTREELWDAVEKSRTVMLVDQGPDGLRARPMGFKVLRDEDVVLFMTERDSAKVDELAREPEACITTAHEFSNLYVSITGRTYVIDIRALVHEHFEAAAKAMYDGPDDPRVVLLRFRPEKAQIWKGSPAPLAGVQMLFGMVSDSPPDLGEVKRVDL